MRTPIHYRVKLSFETLGGFHPGSGEGDGLSDADITRDGFGRPLLRSPAIIGPIRHAMLRAGFPDREITVALGGAGGDDGPSLIAADDAALRRVVLERRDGVGIDRVTATASDSIKYDRLVVARGALFDVVLTADCDEARVTLVEEMLATVVLFTRTGQLRFGACTTRGLGALALREHSVKRIDDLTPASTLAATKAMFTGVWPDWDLHHGPRNVSAPVLRFTVGWHVLSAMFSKSATLHDIVNVLPLTARVTAPDANGVSSGHVALLLSGATIKGVLRSRAEYQVRTELAVSADPDARLNEQADVIGARDLFGWANDVDDSGRIGAVSVDDCYSLRRVPLDAWREIEQITFEETADTRPLRYQRLREALDRHGLSAWRSSVHPTINEFTDGVVLSRLYSVLAPFGDEWEPATLTLDLARIPEADRRRLLALLLSVLRDLRRGDLTFGWGATKGFGQLREGSSITIEHLAGSSEGLLPVDAGEQFDPFDDARRDWRSGLGRDLDEWYRTLTNRVNSTALTASREP